MLDENGNWDFSDYEPSREFVKAVVESIQRFQAVGDFEGDMVELGLDPGDRLKMLHLLLEEFGPDLGEGGPPRNAAMMATIDIALAVGVRLERARWTSTVTP